MNLNVGLNFEVDDLSKNSVRLRTKNLKLDLVYLLINKVRSSVLISEHTLERLQTRGRLTKQAGVAVFGFAKSTMRSTTMLVVLLLHAYRQKLVPSARLMQVWNERPLWIVLFSDFA